MDENSNGGNNKIIKAPPSAVAVPDAGNLMRLADFFVKSKMFPSAQSVAGVVCIIQYGSELGLGPAASLQVMSVISGRIAIESKAMLGLFRRNKGHFNIVEKTKSKSVVKFWYDGEDSHTETFTWEDAKAIGLTTKQPWRQYPEEMIYWRCIAKGLRAYDPNVIMGLYSREEVQDFTPSGSAGDAEGRVPAPPPAIPEPEDDTDPFDGAAPPDHQEWPKAKITLSTGKTVEVDRFKALEFFGSLKNAMGGDLYYAILTGAGYEHANDVHTRDMGKVFKALLDAHTASNETKS